MLAIQTVEIILYVQCQQESTSFYQKLLGQEPVLCVPGMTEFRLSPNCTLGLMPNTGIATILADKMPHPEQGTGIPRCELYLCVANVATAFAHAVQIGAKVIQKPADRDWGDRVGYLADSDGHILAVAEKLGGR